ncbi:MAG: hypothetical protein ABIY38_12445, partial [Rhodococcus sp. (in: high G+C Gram-positive bacteria)]
MVDFAGRGRNITSRMAAGAIPLSNAFGQFATRAISERTVGWFEESTVTIGVQSLGPRRVSYNSLFDVRYQRVGPGVIGSGLRCIRRYG